MRFLHSEELIESTVTSEDANNVVALFADVVDLKITIGDAFFELMYF
jgi:hypothetical protein